jgi:CHAT domain-containing protein
MRNRLHDIFLLVWMAGLLSPFVGAQSAPNDAVADEAAIRRLVATFYDLHAKKDLDAMTALFSPQSPILAARREMWTRLFPLESYQFTTPIVSRIRFQMPAGFARVAVERTATDARDSQLRKTDVRADWVFIRENGAWKFFSESPATISLYNDLAAAKTDAERETLLADDPSLVTRELLTQLMRNSDFAYTAGDQARALRLLSAARMAAERLDDKRELAGIWQNLGIIHLVQARPQPALEAYQRALALNESLGRKPEIARSLGNIGLAYSALGKAEEAIGHFERGMRLHEELGEKPPVAQALENIGNVHYDQGRYPAALEFYRKSAEAFDAAGAKAAAINRLIKIAKTEYELGADAAAIEAYEQAAGRMIETGERGALGFAWHSIANIHYSQGDYAQALRFYQKSLQAERASGNVSSQANALLGIGLVHSINGHHALSLEAYEKNLAIAETLNNRADMAVALQKTGGAHYNLGQYTKALELFQRAVALREELNDPQETAVALLDAGITHAALEAPEKAIEHYDRSRDLFESARNFSGVASALLNKSMIFFSRKDFAQALELADRAAAAAKQGDDADAYWQARHRAGRANYRMDRLPAAREALTDAIATIETMRAQTNHTSQPRFFESRIAPYLAMVDVAIAEGKGGDAFNFAERAKARTLLGIVQSAKVRITKTMRPAEREREARLLNELTRLPAQIAREQEKPQPNKPRIAELSAALKRVRGEYEVFRPRLYRTHPQLKVMRGEGKALSVKQARSMVTDARAAMLSFVETDEQVYLFVVTKPTPARRDAPPVSPLKIYVLGTNRGDLYQRVAALNQALARRDERWSAMARELYELLLKPAEAQLAGKDRWTLVPDGAMWNLPFEALPATDQRPLIESVTLSRAPSLTAFQAIARLRPATSAARRTARAKAAPVLLAMGLPELSEPTAERLRALPPAESVTLDSTRELEAVTAAYAENQRTIYRGTEASEARLKQEAGGYRILHLASRTVLNEAAPLYSAVALAAANGEDGMLDWRELMGLDLKTSLVVFSATEAVLPHAGASRSLTGLVWSLYVAGCPAALVNQWPGDPAAVAELMPAFHRELQTSKQPARAWQTALRQLMAREEFRHPFFWAGFQLLGDAR